MRSTETIIISDVHLGSFVARSKELLQVLKSYRMRRLVMNGDFLAGLNLSNFREDDWALLSYIRELSTPSRNIEVVWVAGNHDSAVVVLSKMLGVPVTGEYVFEWGGKRCLAIHGHQFDRFLNRNFVISTLGTRVFHLIQRLDSEKQRVSRFIERTTNVSPRLTRRVSAGATWYAKYVRRASVVFCGHTHQDLHLVMNGVDYWNSGSWTDIPSTFITMDDADGIQIRKVE